MIFFIRVTTHELPMIKLLNNLVMLFLVNFLEEKKIMKYLFLK